MSQKQANTGKPILILFFVQFLVMVGFGIVIPILPFLVSKMGGTPISLGIFMAAYSIMQFFFAPFWGRLSDQIGRRPVLLIGLAGYGSTFMLMGLADSLWILIAIRALAGVISSATLPTAMAYLADITDEGPARSKAMGMVGAAMGLGMIFGPALGGWLGHYSFAAPFFVAGGLALLVMPFAWMLLPETLKKGTNRPVQTRPKLTLAVVKDPLFVLFVFNFIISFTMAMYESTFAYLAASKVGFGTREMGITFTVAGVAGVIIQGGLIGKLVKKFGEASLVAAGAIICAAGLVLILWSGSAVTIILATVVYMSGSSLMGPTSSSLVTKHAKDGQGVSLGFFQSFGSLGRILGPIIGGTLYGLSMGLPYIAGAALLVLMMLFGGRRISGYSFKPAAQEN
ncbi:MAG TPA: MFS transporter [Verrucomicrobiae bacterium]|nr:MFS transporter [Verrucomicrobiae bacterium]